METRPRRRRLGFYRRLSRVQQREYDRSDAIDTLPLRPGEVLGAATNRLVQALEGGEPAAVRRAAQRLSDAICAALPRPKGPRHAPAAPRIRVLRVRPRLASGEFHGLYTQSGEAPAEIRLWMFTAQHRQVVRPRTFLRTLLHEICHHLDMTLLDLPNSLHTLGFHARESYLVRVLERSGGRIPGGRREVVEERPRPGLREHGRQGKPERQRQERGETVRPPQQLDLFPRS